jgi:hypothetical protein
VIANGRCTVAGKGGIDAHLPKTELEIGEEVSLEILLSRAAGTVALKARVKNRRGRNHGFEFLENAGRVTVTLKALFQPEAIIFNLAVPEAADLFAKKIAEPPPERMPVADDVTLVLQSDAAEVQLSARLVNISRNGLRISHAYAQLAAGQRVKIIYVGVSIPAYVVWNRDIDGHLESGLSVLEEEAAVAG